MGLSDSCDVWMSFAATPSASNLPISAAASALLVARTPLAPGPLVSTPIVTVSRSGAPDAVPVPVAVIVAGAALGPGAAASTARGAAGGDAEQAAASAATTASGASTVADRRSTPW